MIEWLDAHTHLDSGELYSDVQGVLARAYQSGVKKMLLVNSEATQQSLQRTVECAGLSHPVGRFAALGIHPHHASQYSEDLQKTLEEFLALPRVIAFGEIGLDYYYNYSPREVQIDVLRKQLDQALKLSLPVVIHCRDAYGDLADILASENKKWRGMIHCFTGTPAEAESLLDLGFFISFSGIVTFRNAISLREAARILPADRILIETDAPYLAPVPHRGKRNEPAFVIHTGQFLASHRQTSDEALSRQILLNFAELFGV